MDSRVVELLMRCRGVAVHTLQKETGRTDAIAPGKTPLLEKREKWGTPPFSGSSIENHQSKIINPPYTCSLASPKVTVTSIFFFPR
jgi:hypothetical protein